MLKSIKNFTIEFTGTIFGDVSINQLVSDGTAISHGWEAENGSVQSGINGGSTIMENANDTYIVSISFPQDNQNVRTLQDIIDLGKGDGELQVGNFFLNDRGNGRNVESTQAFISAVNNDDTGSDNTTPREFTFMLANAKATRI